MTPSGLVDTVHNSRSATANNGGIWGKHGKIFKSNVFLTLLEELVDMLWYTV
jgi:hypothetical protein